MHSETTTEVKSRELSKERAALLEKRLAGAARAAGVRTAQTRIANRKPEDRVPLSFSQGRLWFLDKLMPGNSVFTIAQALHLEFALDVKALEAAVKTVVTRHEVLRTVFDEDIDGPLQIVKPSMEIPVELIDVSNVPPDQQEKEVHRIACAEVSRPYDLRRGPLLRVTAFRLAHARWIVAVAIHHIISDVWSMQILIQELQSAYAQCVSGGASQLQPLHIQYGDYAIWQRKSLTGDLLDRQFAFWEKKLAGLELLRFPTDRPRPPQQSYRGGHIRVQWPAGLSARLAEIGQREGATLFMVSLAAFYALLSRYTNQEDIVVGTPVAGRGMSETDPLIGFFVNSLAMRGDVSGDPTFLELIRRVREQALAAYSNQELPFEVLVERLQPARDLSRHPLFQVTFQLMSMNRGRTDSDAGRPPIEVRSPFSGFDLVFDLWGDAEGVAGRVDYSTDLFDRETIQQFLDHYIRVLTAIAENPGRRVSELPLLSPAEQTKILQTWNNTGRDFPLAPMHELVRAQASKTPDAIAVVMAGEPTLTFAQLEARANCIAGLLQTSGVARGSIVGLCAPRSPAMVAGILGILKAGAAYLPLDPAYPVERLSYTLRDSGAQIVLVTAATAGMFDSVEELRIDSVATTEHITLPESSVDDLAYILYTSGSTGKPKGVMIQHGALANHMLWMQQEFPLAPNDSVLQRTPFTFDASVWEFFAPLMSGAQMVLAPAEAHFDPATLVRTIRSKGITVLQAVPSLLRALLDEPAMADCTSLKRVFAGGEALTGDLRDRFFELLPNCLLCNLYGPTEATIDATFYVAQKNETAPATPIGRPISNLRTYILDSHGQPVPPNVEGELYLAGAGLSRGYLNLTDLTTSRFVPDPFQPNGAKMYRTGDRCRYLNSGVIEYLGRADGQVKVRGFRIELGEVEHAIRQTGLVEDCAVVVREDHAKNKYLDAYLALPDADAPSLTAALRDALARLVPPHMVPSAFHLLAALPTLSNGKVDRKALDALECSEPTTAHVAPRTPLERDLMKIWLGLLPVANIGIHDDFFQMGAHSLLAIQFVSRIRRELNVDLPLRDIFEHPTIAQLASAVTVLRQATESAAPVSTTIPKVDRSRFRVAASPSGPPTGESA